MKIKNMRLTKEEKKILKDVESGKYISDGNIEAERKRLQLIAQNTIQLRKTKNVNIRIREDDLNKLSIVFNYFFTLIHQENTGKLNNQQPINVIYFV